MSPFSREFSTSSPVLAIPPHSSHQAMRGISSLTNSHEHPLPFDSMPANSTFGMSSQSMTPSCISRKRSRDEAAINLEPDVPIVPEAVEESQEDWTYGEGMVLIKPNAGYVADAASQSGTWLEEKKDVDEEARLRLQEELSVLRNPKSQRLDHSTGGISTATVSTGGSPPSTTGGNTSFTSTEGPVVDDFTLHLGIGWRKISDEEHIQAAARGWARYIENHYPLNNACVVLESRGLQSYLVETSEGFFLFAEDLRQGRMVSTNVEGTLRNLQCSPPRFDGADSLLGAETPRLPESQSGTPAPSHDTAMNMD